MLQANVMIGQDNEGLVVLSYGDRNGGNYCEPVIPMREFVEQNQGKEIFARLLGAERNTLAWLLDNPDFDLISLKTAAESAGVTEAVCRDLFVKGEVLAFKIVVEKPAQWVTFTDQVEKIRELRGEEPAPKSNGRVLISRQRRSASPPKSGKATETMYRAGYLKKREGVTFSLNKKLKKALGDRVVFYLEPEQQKLILRKPADPVEAEASYKLTHTRGGNIFTVSSHLLGKELKRRGLSPALGEWRVAKKNGGKEYEVDLYSPGDKRNPEGVQLIAGE